MSKVIKVTRGREPHQDTVYIVAKHIQYFYRTQATISGILQEVTHIGMVDSYFDVNESVGYISCSMEEA